MKKGFTLIELLVVVAIIGVLGAIAVSTAGRSSVDTAPQTSTPPATEAVAYPDPTNYAVDTAGVLTQEQLASLNTKLKAMDNDKHQFGVAVVKSLGGLTIEGYSIKLAEKWKVGHAKLDNGAIIVLAPNERKVRIEVGYGLTGDLNSGKVGRIMDQFMIPALKQSDWYGALDKGVDALAANVQ